MESRECGFQLYSHSLCFTIATSKRYFCRLHQNDSRDDSRSFFPYQARLVHTFCCTTIIVHFSWSRIPRRPPRGSQSFRSPRLDDPSRRFSLLTQHVMSPTTWVGARCAEPSHHHCNQINTFCYRVPPWYQLPSERHTSGEISCYNASIYFILPKNSPTRLTSMILSKLCPQDHVFKTWLCSFRPSKAQSCGALWWDHVCLSDNMSSEAHRKFS